MLSACLINSFWVIASTLSYSCLGFLLFLTLFLTCSISFQLAGLLGCVVGLKTAVTGITLVALGTSLPDTFASRSAALHDEFADNSIGNVTG